MTPKSFAEFWPFYVGEHANRRNRRLHFAGTLGGPLVLAAGLVFEPALALPAALIWGYGCAWTGHFIVERNRPATFRHPFWSFLGDWKMFVLMLTGRMDAEIARLDAMKAARK